MPADCQSEDLVSRCYTMRAQCTRLRARNCNGLAAAAVKPCAGAAI
jgi:hypothetical protein